jgi:hypothetical protein
MQAQKEKIVTLKIMLPLLHGSVSTAISTCGKPNCACKATPPKLHGVYYRWTGLLEGKYTTRTLSREEARECQRRIKNYRRLQRQIEKLLDQELAKAPWKEGVNVKR